MVIFVHTALDQATSKCSPCASTSIFIQNTTDRLIILHFVEDGVHIVLNWVGFISINNQSVGYMRDKQNQNNKKLKSRVPHLRSSRTPPKRSPTSLKTWTTRHETLRAPAVLWRSRGLVVKGATNQRRWQELVVPVSQLVAPTTQGFDFILWRSRGLVVMCATNQRS